MPTKQARRQSLDFDVEDEDQYYVSRPHTSARRYDISAQRDTMDTPVTQTGGVIRRSSIMTPAVSGGVTSKAVAPSLASRVRHARRFPLIAIVLGMMMMALLAITFGAI